MTLQNQVKIRKMKPTDEAFIYSSWLRSYRNSDFASHISNAIYYDAHKQIVSKLLEECEVFILCSHTDEDHIYGFICYTNLTPKLSTLHFLYIKYSYRKMGLANYMYDATVGQHGGSTICITHNNSYLKDKINSLGLIFNPYLLWK